MIRALIPAARLLVVGALCLAQGCVGTAIKEQNEGSGYAALFGGKSELPYATEFPVGSAAEALVKGDAALAAGDSDRALFEYIRALRKDGDNAEAFYKIGVIHAVRGNHDLAETSYRRALATDPRHAGAMTGLGILLTRKRDYAGAETQLLAALRIDPKLPGAHNALGVLADIKRDHGRAQGHFLDGLALAPNSSTLHNNLGYSHYLAGKNQAAIAEFRAALEINPQYAMAWRNLGLVYTRQGKYEAALDAFKKVQDLPQAYNDIGYIAMVAGRLDEAQSFFDEAMRLSPEYYPTAGENARRVRTLKGK